MGAPSLKVSGLVLGKCVSTSSFNSLSLLDVTFVVSKLPSAHADVILTCCKSFATVVSRKSNLRKCCYSTEKQESEITTLKSISNLAVFYKLVFLAQLLGFGLGELGVVNLRETPALIEVSEPLNIL